MNCLTNIKALLKGMKAVSLFDFATEEPGMLFGSTPGFRLHKLEVYNWGTFDKAVWTLAPGGEPALLTGDVGSGKSTLVDALTTLLVAPRKVTYNKAADSSAKERNVTSYVRGYFGLKRNEEGVGQPDALRDVENYSVLLATFFDPGLVQYVTLAQVFWFQDAQKSPVRFYVVADAEMNIIDGFSSFGRDIRILKKRLRGNQQVQLFEDYPAYAAVFRRKFGIVQEQALDLFQQTISMKKVEALTGFVRANMLEDPGMETEVKKLIMHFHDLDCAHEAVCKAKRQIELAMPIVEQGKRCSKLQEESQVLYSASRALGAWFAEQLLLLLGTQIVKLEKELVLAGAERETSQAAVVKSEENIRSTEREITLNGGGALERLKEELAKSKMALVKVEAARQHYQQQAQKLELTLPDTLDEFIKNRNGLPELRSFEEIRQEELHAEISNASLQSEKVKTELAQVGEELASLRLRQSSIPHKYVEKRRELCRSLNLPEAKLPFVGELLEVKNGEEIWEGAIERLLHNFGLSLLVPDEYYAAVAQWVDKTALGMRIVYYRVQQEEVRAGREQAHPFSVGEKLAIKEDSPFARWLEQEVKQRFAYVCCDAMDSFRRERQAITLAGQIKTNGKRHEKDDRHSLNDRRNFILGFSNQKKIGVLEEAQAKLRAEMKKCETELTSIREKMKESQARLNALDDLTRRSDFAEIDLKSNLQLIAEMEERRQKLEMESDLLKALQNRLLELQAILAREKEELDGAKRAEIELQSQLKNLRKNEADAKTVAAQADDARRGENNAFLELHQAEALRGEILATHNMTSLEHAYRKWLEEKRNGVDAAKVTAREKIAKTMTDYKNKYPEETREIDASWEALGEYEKLLAKLQTDGLPKYEKKFKELLHKNTINQIALFQAQLRRQQEMIQERITQINASLNGIDYNEGRYIRLEYDETYDSDIKEFRVKLKSCTEGALTGSDDEQYAEAKFLQVKEIVERFKGRPGLTELDERWTKKVIDVRNWFLFAASERWRETDEEYEHYTDSGGKSGGQKEKLAYTILAASLVYHFGLERDDKKPQSFRFVVIDEAFLKSSDESARFGLQLFERLDLQLLIVTPLMKIPTIAQFVKHVGFVHHDDEKHQSKLRNISIEEYRRERQAAGGGRVDDKLV